nr:hypothetical protein [uncultured Methanospirillum sp.]
MILSDFEIQEYIGEKKRLKQKLRRLVFHKKNIGNEEARFEIVGETGRKYELLITRNSIFIESFSIVLLYVNELHTKRFRLRRYNGKHASIHKNFIEKTKFVDCFHIHYATERYQRAGYDEDKFAEETDRFTSIPEALDCLFADCNIMLGTGDTRGWFK